MIYLTVWSYFEYTALEAIILIAADAREKPRQQKLIYVGDVKGLNLSTSDLCRRCQRVKDTCKVTRSGTGLFRSVQLRDVQTVHV
eukprot:7600-Heterococcus_DN1.PRE.2